MLIFKLTTISNSLFFLTKTQYNTKNYLKFLRVFRKSGLVLIKKIIKTWILKKSLNSWRITINSVRRMWNLKILRQIFKAFSEKLTRFLWKCYELALQ